MTGDRTLMATNATKIIEQLDDALRNQISVANALREIVAKEHGHPNFVWEDGSLVAVQIMDGDQVKKVLWEKEPEMPF